MPGLVSPFAEEKSPRVGGSGRNATAAPGTGLGCRTASGRRRTSPAIIGRRSIGSVRGPRRTATVSRRPSAMSCLGTKLAADTLSEETRSTVSGQGVGLPI